MFRKILIITIALIGVSVPGAAANGKLLARDSSMSSVAYVVYQTPMRFGDNFELLPSPYSSFMFQIAPPRGQRVETTWSIGCHKGDFSRDLKGKAVRRGFYSRTLRPPIAAADFCTLSVTASRSYDASGKIVVALFGQANYRTATMREP